MISVLESLGLEVWEPFVSNNPENFLEPGWAYRIGQKDFADVVNSDTTFAVVNGVLPDEGVMVELGMAIALSKPTSLFRDDFRRATDSEEYPELNAVRCDASARLAGLLSHLIAGDHCSQQDPGPVDGEQ